MSFLAFLKPNSFQISLLFDSLIFYRIVSLIYSFLFCRCLLNNLLDGFLIFSQEHISVALYRGYYTAARRYEISLRVSKNISRMRAVNEKRNFLSPSDRVMFFSDYMNTNEITNHLTFAATGAICYVKITYCFHV